MVRGLGYIVIGTRDLDAWRHFACDVLGMMAGPVSLGGSDAQSALHLRIDDSPLRIRLERAEEDRLIATGWQLANAAALRSAIAALEAAHVDVEIASDVLAATRCAGAVARFRDPSGNQHELYHGTIYDHEAFVSPVGGRGFETGDLGMGHVVLPADDVASCRDLFASALGFRVSDELAGPPHISFLRCNPRHHSLAFAALPTPTGLVHFMLECKTLDDVGYALDRAEKAGMHLSATLGKHTNDRMVSFYVRSPSGFDVEVGCGGIRVDEATWTTNEITAPSFWGHRWDFG